MRFMGTKRNWREAHGVHKTTMQSECEVTRTRIADSSPFKNHRQVHKIVESSRTLFAPESCVSHAKATETLDTDSDDGANWNS